MVALSEQAEEVTVRVDAVDFRLEQLGAPAHEGQAEEEEVVLGSGETSTGGDARRGVVGTGTSVRAPVRVAVVVVLVDR